MNIYRQCGVILTSSVILGLFCPPQVGFAQNAIAPDNTLPSNTLVNFNNVNKTYTITGGTQVDVNQFHSFQDFSVPTGNTAHFDTLPTTVNAISRVTGANISNIDGLVKANGTTNLYLINPNGIVFGKDARLEIGGSFGASTANSFKFPDGSEFSATNPQAPPLLNVNVPLGLQYGKSNTGATISNQGDLAAGQDLVLNADKLDLQGTLQAGRDLTLQAQDSVLVTNGAQLSSSTFGQGNAGNIIIKAENSVTFINSSAFSIVEQGAVGNAGNVEISTRSLELFGSFLGSNTFGQGDAGTVKITAIDSIKFDSNSAVESLVISGAVGKAGVVEISTKTLELFGGSYIDTSSLGQGDAGTVKITATDSIKFDGNSSAGSVVGSGAVGKAGVVEISTKTLELLGGSFLDTSTFGQGDAGTVKITATNSIKFDGYSAVGSEVRTGAVGNAGGVEISTKILELFGGSFLSSNTFGQGDAGTVKINATDLIEFDGNSYAVSRVEVGAVGKAGGVEIFTKTLELLGGSFLITNTLGQGDAGTVKIIASDSIKFDGKSSAESVVLAGAVGNAGGVQISTKTLELLGGSFLSSSTFGQGNAGTVKITATDSIKFDGKSSAESLVVSGAVGNAGSVEISTKILELLGGSLLNSNTFGQGNAGTVKITASDSIKFDGKSSAESVVLAGAVGKAGGVEISTKTLELLGDSYIDTSTLGQGNAGTVKIIATDSIKFDGNSAAGSQVRTGAVGNAGGLEISSKTLELFGGSFLSSGTFGQGNAGTVKIIATDSIRFDGDSFAESAVGSGAVGNAGGVEISTKTLELLGGSLLSSNTFGQGDAGTVKITATNSIVFDGKSSAESLVAIGAVGNAGGVEISTKTLELFGGSYFDTSTLGQGNAGTVKIAASDSIKFDGYSSVSSQVRTGAVGNAGGVEMSSKTLELLSGSFLSSSTFSQGAAGTVKITATDLIKFDGKSSAESAVVSGAVGNAGGVEISTKTLELLGASYLSSNTFGQGNAGTVKINATDSIKFDGKSSAGSQVSTEAVGNAGGVEISTKTLELLGGSFIDTSSFGKGNAGTVKINATDSIKYVNSSAQSVVIQGALGNAGGLEISTKTLELLGDSSLDSGTFGQGDAGTVKINATDSIKFDGNSFTQSVVGRGAVGKAGGVEISTKTLELLGNSTLSVSTFGEGDAGTVKITATDSIAFDGNSGAISQVAIGAVGNAGGLEIFAKTIELLGGSFIDSSTFGQGNAGTVKITATDFIKLLNGSSIDSVTSSSGDSGKIAIIAGNSLILDGNKTGILARTEANSTGNGGSIIIDPPLVSITNGAGITVDSLGKGNGGNLTIFAGKFVFSNNAFLSANTASGEGGNINLQIVDVFFPRNNSNINATAGGNGNGGNIYLSALFTIAIPSENSDIFANAFLGRGGNIKITTQGIFGLELRPRLTNLSDITASSEFGLQGNVNINTPGVDPSKGLTNLPVNTSDPSRLVKQSCIADRNDSKFIITGKGGIPAKPSDRPIYTSVLDNLGRLPNPSQTAALVSSNFLESKVNPDAIIEATGWIINDKNQVVLVAGSVPTQAKIRCM